MRCFCRKCMDVKRSKKINMFGFSHFLDVVGLDIPRESFCHTEGTIEDLRFKNLNLRILKP